MAFLIDDFTAEQIRVIGQGIADSATLKRDEIALNDGNPVEWTESERLNLLKAATLLAYLDAMDVACYPLSDSAVIFFP
jgi:hypothetical protein